MFVSTSKVFLQVVTRSTWLEGRNMKPKYQLPYFPGDNILPSSFPVI